MTEHEPRPLSEWSEEAVQALWEAIWGEAALGGTDGESDDRRRE